MPWPNGKCFHILTFPATNQARGRWWRRFSQRYNPLQHTAAFPLQWLWGGWAAGQKRWWAKQAFFAFGFGFSRVGLGSLALPPGQDSTGRRWGRWGFKALTKAQAVLPSRQCDMTSQGSMAPHPLGLHLLLLGVSSEAVPGCALPMPPALPLGWEPHSSSQVSVQASVSLPGVKTSRAAVFSPSAYKNKKLPFCPFLLAENRQLREGPARAGRTSGPRTSARRELLQPRLFLTCFYCTLAAVSPITFFLLCVSLQLLPATVRCVNYIWPGKSATGSIFKPSRPPVCRLLWRSFTDFASFSWEWRVPSSSLWCWARYFLPSTTQPSGHGLTSRDLGSSRPCVCAGESLSPAVVTVWLSESQLQPCEMRWLFWPAKCCQQTWWSAVQRRPS